MRVRSLPRSSRRILNWRRQLPHPQFIYSPNHRQKCCNACHPKPVRFPPWRKNRKVKRNPLLIPNSIIIGGLDAKRIVAGVKMGIGGKTTRGIGVLPVSIELFQFIGIPVFLWGGVVQRRELEAKDRLVVAESDARRDMDGLLERRVLATDFYRFVEQLKLREHHRRRGWVINKLVGIKGT